MKFFNYINDGSMNTVINRRRKFHRLFDDYFVNSANMKLVYRLNLEYDKGIGFVAQVKAEIACFLSSRQILTCSSVVVVVVEGVFHCTSACFVW